MVMPSIDIDKINKSDAAEEVKEVYKRVKRDLIDSSARNDWKAMREKNWHGTYPLEPEKDESIWTEAERKAMIDKGQIPIAVNDLAKGVQGSCAVITSKNPGLQFLPIGTSDLYVAELLKRGWDYVLSCNNGTLCIYDVAKEWKIGGLTGWEVKHDISKGIFGKICIDELDPTEYYFDADSKKRDHSDVSFGKAHMVTKEYALETYDDLTEEDLIFNEMRPDEDEGATVDTKIGKDNYAEGDKAETDDKKDEPNVWEIEDWELTKEKQFWLMITNPEDPSGYTREIYKTTADIEKRGWALTPDKKEAVDAMGVKAFVWKRMVEQRIQRIIVGKKMVSKLVNPLDMDSDGDPVLSISVLQHDRTLRGYPTCPTTRAMELTRSRNKRRMQSIYVVSKQVDATLVMPQAAKWVKDEKHGDYIEVAKDAPFPPTRLSAGTTTAELLNMEQIDKADIQDEFDINDVLRGKIPQGQSNMAGRTVLALQDMVGVMANPYAQAFENALVRLGKAVAIMMIKAWPQGMWKRLIEPDEMTTWQPDKLKKLDENGQQIPPEPDQITTKWQNALELLRPSDPLKEPGVGLIDLDIKLIAGSTQPTNRMAKQGVAIEMVQAGIYDVEAALEYVDDPQKDKVIERQKQKAQSASAEKINVSIAFKDLPPEAQAQLAQQIGIQMNPESGIQEGGYEQ